MTDLAAEVRHAVAAGGAFLAIVGAAEVWARRGGSPERTRKLVHVAGGVLALSFPWLFHSAWTVLALAVLSAGLLGVGRRLGFLRSVHSVGRKSRGAEYYPFAVAIVFVLASDRPWLYAAAIVVLAAADTCAALIGMRFGRLRYEVEDDTKSVEGSFAFLGISVAAVALPMLLGTGLPLANVAAAAVLVAILVTLVEAVSLNGGDNIVVPLTGTLALDAAAGRTPAENAAATATLLGILVSLGFVVRHTRAFNVGAMLVIVLFSFGVWALGGWTWAFPTVCGFVPYMLLRHGISGSDDYIRHAKVRVLSRVLLPPFAIALLAGRAVPQETLYGPFLASCASILALSVWRFLLWKYRPDPARRIAGAAATALAAWALLVAMPGRALGAGPLEHFLPLLTTLAAVVTADRLLGADPALDPSHLWPRSQVVLASAAALVVLGAQAAGWVPAWNGVLP